MLLDIDNEQSDLDQFVVDNNLANDNDDLLSFANQFTNPDADPAGGASSASGSFQQDLIDIFERAQQQPHADQDPC